MGPETDPLLSTLKLQAAFKCEMQQLELKSSQTILAIKLCQRTKNVKVIYPARSSLKKWPIYGPLAVKLLSCFKLEQKSWHTYAVDCFKGALAWSLGQKVVLSFNGYWEKGPSNLWLNPRILPILGSVGIQLGTCK